MSISDFFDPDTLYRQGLQSFNRGEWQTAITAFTSLQAHGARYPGVEELLADARLKARMASAEPPVPVARPRGPLLRRGLMAAVVVLLCVVGFQLTAMARSAPAPVAAVALALPTAVPPTATPEPTAIPEPTPTMAPTEVPVLAGSVVITPSDEGTFVNTPRNIEIIVDASGSMQAEIDGSGKQRWQVAQDALNSLINSGTITGQSAVALRTYGRQRGGDCNDVEVLQKLSRFKPDALLSAVGTIKPAVGARTPLAASIRAASDDLITAEGTTALIVVTDGDESCNGDPAAEAAAFVAGGPQRQVHVIGFALDDPTASERLRQIAVNGNGIYIDATNSAELAAALRQTIELSYQIVAEDGTEAATGTVGKSGPVQLAPGTYKVTINASPSIVKVLTVQTGESLAVELRQGYGGLLADVHTITP